MCRSILVVKFKRRLNALGTLEGTIRAQEGQARYPTGASTLPNWGKHVAQMGQARCPFFDKLVYLKRVVSRLYAKQKNNDRLEVEKQT